MQRLITQHQSELATVKQQSNDACQQRLHDLMVQVASDFALAHLPCLGSAWSPVPAVMPVSQINWKSFPRI